MPRISDERRAARRAQILAAARRCFARQGFERTSMPDLVAEAGMSAGGFYRYFRSKDEVVREIAHQAFGILAGTVAARLGEMAAPTLGEVVEVVTAVLRGPTLPGPDGPIDTDEQFRCAVQAWGQLLRDPDLQAEARAGAQAFSAVVAEALARGSAAGRAPADLDPHDGARLVFSLLPGLILWRTVLGDDLAPVARAATALSAAPPLPAGSSLSHE